MGKNTKQQKKDQEIQAKSEEILAKIEADRAAGNLAAAEERKANIKAAKEKLNDAYKKIAEMEKRSQQAAKKRDPSTHTYSEEEKQRILEHSRQATARYIKLRDFTERYERMQRGIKLDEMKKEMREQAAKAASDKESKD